MPLRGLQVWGHDLVGMTCGSCTKPQLAALVLSDPFFSRSLSSGLIDEIYCFRLTVADENVFLNLCHVSACGSRVWAFLPPNRIHPVPTQVIITRVIAPPRSHALNLHSGIPAHPDFSTMCSPEKKRWQKQGQAIPVSPRYWEWGRRCDQSFRRATGDSTYTP